MSNNNSIAIDTHNRMSMDELEEVLTTNAKLIMDNDEMGAVIPPLLIHSSPCIGKSSIVKEVAKTLGIQLVDVRLAEMESVDIRGLPSVEKNDNNEGIMRWNAPDCWPRDPKSKGIIFLDEITSCDKSCQVAAYELILDRKIGDFYKVPDGWYIVSAGNLTTDRAVATSMSSALANRFLHIELKEDPDQWIKWGTMNKVHPSVLGFIRYRPEFLFSMENENLERGWPSPRSWERVSHMVKIYGNNEPILRKMVYGLVGPAKGLEFMEFFKLNEQFENVLDMMYGKIPVKIPTKNDQRYAMCSTLIYQVWRGENTKDENARIGGFYNIVKELPPEFIMMCIQGAMHGTSKENTVECTKKMYSHPMYAKCMEKYHKYINESNKK